MQETIFDLLKLVLLEYSFKVKKKKQKKTQESNHYKISWTKEATFRRTEDNPGFL